MVGFARALIADPQIIAKHRAGRSDLISSCTGCNECHYGRPVTCAVNARAGREEELPIDAAAQSKSVLVIGGGPAGMECARFAATRGHRVRLVEATDRLGGMLRDVLADGTRTEMVDHLDTL